jgi:N,N'-diacetyllegionaminate synthase
MKHVFIIAEAGVNHNGKLEPGFQLIDAAVEAGVDAVKFQTFKAESLVSKYAERAGYQQKNMKKPDETQFEMIKRLELSTDSYKKLLDYCNKKGIVFLSSPFDIESIEFLDSLGMEIIKIPSGEITNLPYLRTVGGLNKKVIMSTGMANLGEIEQALDILTGSGTAKERITLLHCNTEYPTPVEDVNLSAMQTIREAFKVDVGYSDHTLGVEVPIAAAALGAVVIEKHFTLDRNMEGPDHKASLEPGELKRMVLAIRNIEKALGDGIKKPSPSEIKNIPIVRKSIVASRKIKAGALLSDNNMTVKRPGDGISPMKWDEISGRSANRNFNEDELIEI